MSYQRLNRNDFTREGGRYLPISATNAYTTANKTSAANGRSSSAIARFMRTL